MWKQNSSITYIFINRFRYKKVSINIHYIDFISKFWSFMNRNLSCFAISFIFDIPVMLIAPIWMSTLLYIPYIAWITIKTYQFLPLSWYYYSSGCNYINPAGICTENKKYLHVHFNGDSISRGWTKGWTEVYISIKNIQNKNIKFPTNRMN